MRDLAKHSPCIHSTVFRYTKSNMALNVGESQALLPQAPVGPPRSGRLRQVREFAVKVRDLAFRQPVAVLLRSTLTVAFSEPLLRASSLRIYEDILCCHQDKEKCRDEGWCKNSKVQLELSDIVNGMSICNAVAGAFYPRSPAPPSRLLGLSVLTTDHTGAVALVFWVLLLNECVLRR